MRIRSLGIALFSLVSVIVLETSWFHYLELHERQRARNLLSNVKECILSTDGDSLNQRFTKCAYNVRTTDTGDIFAYNLVTRKYVYESSIDFDVEGEPVISESGMCQIHQRPDLCVAGLKTIDLGYDSGPNTQLAWQFDDAYELLEWVIFPSEHMGINGKYRGSLTQPQQVAIVLGIQEDELRANFSTYSIIIKVIGGLGILITLILDARLRKTYGEINP